MKLNPKVAFPILILLAGILSAAALIAARSDVGLVLLEPAWRRLVAPLDLARVRLQIVHEDP